MKKIVVISSYRMLLIYLLIEKIELYTTQYIFEEKFNIEMIHQINFCIKKYDIFTKNYFKKIYYKLMKIIEIKKFVYKNKISTTSIVFGAEHIGLGKYLVKKNEFYLIEDGLMNYLDYLYIKNWKKRLLCIDSMGLHKNVKKIYLTGLSKIPNVIENKVEIINLKELWDKKSRVEKKQINKIFKVDINILESLKNRKIILFTQPLSEDSIISEEEKIEIYSKILNKYQKKDIIIKPHPREKTNYSDYFSDCYVMKEKYPVELMIFNGLKVNRAVTLFSTAVFSLNKMVKVDFYGTEVHPKLLKQFGSMDSVMKRNCYL